MGSHHLVSGDRPARFGNAHPNIVPYEPFSTSDGWIAVAVGNNRQWQRLCALAGWEDLAGDSRFSTNPERVKARDELVALLKTRFRSQTSEEWRSDLLEAGVPCAPINAVNEVFADPPMLRRGMLQELPHPSAGWLKLAGSRRKCHAPHLVWNCPLRCWASIREKCRPVGWD